MAEFDENGELTHRMLDVKAMTIKTFDQVISKTHIRPVDEQVPQPLAKVLNRGVPKHEIVVTREKSKKQILMRVPGLNIERAMSLEELLGHAQGLTS